MTIIFLFALSPLSRLLLVAGFHFFIMSEPAVSETVMPEPPRVISRTCWLQASLAPEDSVDLLQATCQQNSSPTTVRDASGPANGLGKGGIDPHKTLWYIGYCDDDVISSIQEVARETDFAQKVYELLPSIPGTVRVEAPFEKHIVLRFSTQDDDAVRERLGRFYLRLNEKNTFAKKAPTVTPFSQPLTPHLTLFEHGNTEDTLAHLDQLKASANFTDFVAAMQKLYFGAVHLAVREKLEDGTTIVKHYAL